VIPEAFGGAGFGRLELAMLAEEVGAALAPIPFASSVYLATEALLLAGTEAQQARLLPRLARGEAIGTFALAERPGQNGYAGVAARFEGDTVTGVKAPVVDGDVADFAVVAAIAPEGPTLALVDLPGPGVTRTRLDSFDPSRSMARLELAGAPAERLGAPGQGRVLAERLLDRAAVLMAFEQIGAATRALAITRQYTLERFAFGRPIGSFQAVKHRLADRWCDIELARSNAYYGAWALEHDASDLGVAACLSRVAASDAFDRMAVDMIQLHGGVGFTWEFDCHLFYRRATLLSTMLGTTASWKRTLVARVSTTKEAA
jgi:alkylation response protein AidB-like acyl-CoA dehydrogenase